MKEIRVRKVLTLEEVQTKLGYKGLYNIEQGRVKSLKCYHVINLADYYQVSPMYLLGLNERTYHIEK